MTSGIYVIQNRATREFYIGGSRNLPRRWRQHLHLLRKGAHCNPRLLAAWQQHGEDAFEFIPIAEIEPAALPSAEQRLLDRLAMRRECYNMALTVDGVMAGRRHNEVARQRMSQSQRGRKATEETKAKMRAAMLGRKDPPHIAAAKSERFRRLNEARRGAALSPEHREKIGEALRRYNERRAARA